MTTRKSDGLLEQFYSALVSDNVSNFNHMHIPRSDVFYVRSAYHAYSGEWISLDRMERAMYLEGHLEAKDVLDPERKREWEE